MKIKQLFEKAIENWPVKAVCFVIAIFIYIFNQQAGMVSRTIRTNIVVGSESGFRPAEAFNTDVSISLRGKSGSIEALSKNDFEAYLDFSYVAKDGKYDFPVLLRLGPNVASINPLEIKVSPEKISLKVEEEIAGFAKIEPLLKGDVPHGYKVDSVSLEPEQVKILGARSLVENCKILQTSNIVLSNAKTSFSGTAAIENLKKNITLDSDKVSYTVKIVQVTEKRTLENVKINTVNLLPNLEISKMSNSISVPVEGNLLDLENLTDFSSVCQADFSQVTEPGTFDVKLLYRLPNGIHLDGNYLKTISAAVVEKTEDESIRQNDDIMEKIDVSIDGEVKQ